MRDFDPIYDAHFFDLAFPYGARPYLLPLDATTPSPFAPELGGRPIGGPADEPAGPPAAGGDAAAGGDGQRVPPVPVETTEMADRIVALPVPEARYSGLRAVKDGLAWLREPVTGTLGIGGAQPGDDAPRPVLERFDFAKRDVCELAGEVDWFEASGDGTRLVTSDHGKLTVIAAERVADGDNPDDKVEVDRSRARFLLDPAAMWRQAYAEAGRIVRHDFWVPDMADVDWDAVQDEYRPLLDRITTSSEFVDVLWEVFGELGTSHAYAYAPDGGTPAAGPGLLGADIERSGDAWRLTRVLRGDTSDPRARAPLAAPGAGIAVGDVLLAVDGQPVGPDGPGPLLTGAAGKPVELTVAPADGSRPRSVPVVPLRSDTRLRYLDWVRAKRAQVRELSGGRIGYLHVPDMVSQGWADFHRDLRTEMLRDALIVDVRGNTGGAHLGARRGEAGPQGDRLGRAERPDSGYLPPGRAARAGRRHRRRMRGIRRRHRHRCRPPAPAWPRRRRQDLGRRHRFRQRARTDRRNADHRAAAGLLVRGVRLGRGKPWRRP